MKHRPIKLINSNSVAEVVEAITPLPLSGKIYEVHIKEYKPMRTEAQKGLKWLWCQDISDYTGESVEEVNHRLKKTHLLPIFENATTGHDEYKPTMAALREVYRQGCRTEADRLLNTIVSKMRTDEANVEEMAAYLTAIEHEAISNQITLRRSDDYALAIYGRKAK